MDLCHYRLLVETGDANLARAMGQLGSAYTQDFNRRHRRTGHLFQGRYKALLVDRDSCLLEPSTLHPPEPGARPGGKPRVGLSVEQRPGVRG